VYSRLLIAALCVSVWGAGCAPMLEVKDTFDPETNFAKYATYDLMPKSEFEMSPAASQEFSGRRQVMEEELVKAVTATMEAKGFERDTENPDIIVSYLVGVRQEVYAASFGFDYNDATGAAVVQTVQDGSMRIDFVDTETNTLVWRGLGFGAVNRDPTEDMIRKNIDRAVKKILDQYPPKKGSS
jgi:hypothetical protein